MSMLREKVAIVTGASRGIGAEIARAMAAAGAAVAVNYVASAKEAGQVVAEIEAAGGRASAVQGDVSEPADAKRVVEETIRAFGAVSVLVNNAATFQFDPLEKITVGSFDRHFHVNVLGPILMTQQVLPHFAAGSSVINIGSASVLTPTARAALYSGSKAALDMVTQVLAKELGPRGIRVNGISPGVTDTESNRALRAGNKRINALIVEKTALGRIGRPSDIAPAAVFLASDDAAWITGAVLNVSGGFR